MKKRRLLRTGAQPGNGPTPDQARDGLAVGGCRGTPGEGGDDEVGRQAGEPLDHRHPAAGPCLFRTGVEGAGRWLASRPPAVARTAVHGEAKFLGFGQGFNFRAGGRGLHPLGQGGGTVSGMAKANHSRPGRNFRPGQKI